MYGAALISWEEPHHHSDEGLPAPEVEECQSPWPHRADHKFRGTAPIGSVGHDPHGDRCVEVPIAGNLIQVLNRSPAKNDSLVVTKA